MRVFFVVAGHDVSNFVKAKKWLLVGGCGWLFRGSLGEFKKNSLTFFQLPIKYNNNNNNNNSNSNHNTLGLLFGTNESSPCNFETPGDMRPRNVTYHLKTDPWNRRFLLETQQIFEGNWRRWFVSDQGSGVKKHR